jgi:cell division protein FtsL
MIDRSSAVILRKIVKLIVFFAIIFALIFCVTWQNVHMYLLNRDIERLAKKRNELEKSLYLMNIEISKLRSRERIKRIVEQKLDMVPVKYKDINLIVY